MKLLENKKQNFIKLRYNFITKIVNYYENHETYELQQY